MLVVQDFVRLCETDRRWRLADGWGLDAAYHIPGITWPASLHVSEARRTRKLRTIEAQPRYPAGAPVARVWSNTHNLLRVYRWVQGLLRVYPVGTGPQLPCTAA